MKVYYLVSAVLAMVNLGVFILNEDDKKSHYYTRLLLTIMCLANLGYLALGLSTSLEEAILANKITYIGGCFLPPVLAACICSLSNIKINRFVRFGCIGFSSFVYGLVLLTGYTNIYYTDIKLGNVYDAAALVVERGALYKLFYIILYGYMIVNVVIIGFTFVKKQVTRKHLYLFAVLQIITSISFLVGRFVAPTFEVLPAVYVINGSILVIIQAQLSKYNLADSIYEAMQQTNTTGYIVLDAEKKFISCNDIAKECIPELAKCQVDTTIENEKAFHFLCEWISKIRENDYKLFTKTLEYNERYYECTMKLLMNRDKIGGYIVEMQDCTDRKKYYDLLSNYNSELEQQVKKQIKHIGEIQQKTILGMASMVENRDNNTGGHIKRTSDVVEIFVETIKENNLLPVTDEFCNDLVKAAPMHDLGKIAIEDRILQKPGRFTDEEFAIMKTHAEKSAEIIEIILRGIDENHFVDIAENVAKFHHEKWNGQGYPMGLSGEQIPLEARIMAIADVYDALVSKRCYKDAMSFSKAYDIIIESMGSHFDPGLEKMFKLSVSRLEEYYKNVEH